MKIDEKYLREKLALFRGTAEKQRMDAIANNGAADAIEMVLKDMSIEEVGKQPVDKGGD